ncbi:hypothetical protein ACFS07_35535 [Undibacterium arcticum]
MNLEQHKFANILAVIAMETPVANRFDVYWKSGVKHQGKKFRSPFLADIADKRIVAELVGMQHLIDDLEALGNTPAIQGIKLVFSASAVKKRFMPIAVTKKAPVPLCLLSHHALRRRDCGR